MNKSSRSHGSLRRHSRSKSLSPTRRRRSSKSSSSSSDSSRSRLPGLDELRKISINIKSSSNGDQSSSARREVMNIKTVTIPRRPDVAEELEDYRADALRHAFWMKIIKGEGSRPIFDREELKRSSSRSERRIVRKSSSRSLSKSLSPRRSRSRSGSNDRSRSRSRSSSRSPSRPRRRPLIDRRYTRKRRSPSRRSTRRHRSRSRDRHPYGPSYGEITVPVRMPVPAAAVRPVPAFYPAPYGPYGGYLPPSVAAAYAHPSTRFRMRFIPPRVPRPARPSQ